MPVIPALDCPFMISGATLRVSVKYRQSNTACTILVPANSRKGDARSYCAALGKPKTVDARAHRYRHGSPERAFTPAIAIALTPDEGFGLPPDALTAILSPTVELCNLDY